MYINRNIFHWALNKCVCEKVHVVNQNNYSFRLLTLQVVIDLIGPLPTPRGNKYVVTLVDYFSKWPEASPLPDKTATGVALFIYELLCR